MMMARAKRICILIVKVNKLFSFFFVAVFSKRNRKHVFRVFHRVIETLVKVWENSKKLWKHSPIGSGSHSISRSPKLPHLMKYSMVARVLFDTFI